MASPVTPPGYIIRLLDRSDAAELAAANDLVNAVGLASSPNPIGPREFPRQLQAILLGLGTPHLPRRTIMFDVVAIDESTGDVVGVAHSRQQAEMFHRIQAAGLPWDNIADTVSLIKLAVAPAHRRQRLGAALVQETLAQAQRSGYRCVVGYADGNVHALQNFYADAGFQLGAVDGSYPIPVFGSLLSSALHNPRSGGFFFWKMLRAS